MVANPHLRAKMRGKSLRSKIIDISGVRLHVRGLHPLLEVLSMTWNLVRLGVRGMGIDSSGAISLAGVLRSLPTVVRHSAPLVYSCLLTVHVMGLMSLSSLSGFSLTLFVLQM